MSGRQNSRNRDAQTDTMRQKYQVEMEAGKNNRDEDGHRKRGGKGYLLHARDSASTATCCCFGASSQPCLRNPWCNVPVNHEKAREGILPEA